MFDNNTLKVYTALVLIGFGDLPSVVQDASEL
jgi:hypothetical protein